MALGEFELIERYLSRLGARRDDVLLGVGDDAALLRPPAGLELALAADTVVEGVHFPAGLDAGDLGHRVLAVNLSDMPRRSPAGCAASPMACTNSHDGMAPRWSVETRPPGRWPRRWRWRASCRPGRPCAAPARVPATRSG